MISLTQTMRIWINIHVYAYIYTTYPHKLSEPMSIDIYKCLGIGQIHKYKSILLYRSLCLSASSKACLFFFQVDTILIGHTEYQVFLHLRLSDTHLSDEVACSVHILQYQLMPLGDLDLKEKKKDFTFMRCLNEFKKEVDIAKVKRDLPVESVYL